MTNLYEGFSVWISGYIFRVFFLFLIDGSPDQFPYQWFWYTRAGSGLKYGVDDPCLVQLFNFLSVLKPSIESVYQYSHLFTDSQAGLDVTFGFVHALNVAWLFVKILNPLISLWPQVNVLCSLPDYSHIRLEKGCVLTERVAPCSAFDSSHIRYFGQACSWNKCSSPIFHTFGFWQWSLC